LFERFEPSVEIERLKPGHGEHVEPLEQTDPYDARSTFFSRLSNISLQSVSSLHTLYSRQKFLAVGPYAARRGGKYCV